MVHYHVEKKPLIREYVSKVGKEPAAFISNNCPIHTRDVLYLSKQTHSKILKKVVMYLNIMHPTKVPMMLRSTKEMKPLFSTKSEDKLQLSSYESSP
jgi:hypothetical protein